ncbi:Pls/PosA family non-ribosomal peptide synthetase [Enterovirga sp.]|uniref:Pls/PosA family non-ribosomal peptide synthetase n=1 Tax=Enterovirga sp. TaxID=2026350 RepID=UPI002D155ED7|nr:Pls/PosA family non-ribosomal peptide synthetase [Enterovirga sp.]HMO29975.1 amino acid adenylation domain-containing protein [Enterovirga sp.]
MTSASSALRRQESGRPEPAILYGDVRPDLLRDETLSEIFAATCRLRGDHLAMAFGDRRLSYAEVDRLSDAIARGLLRLGIGPGSMVGLWMERGPDLLVSQIAITKTGAAWLPFDADAPADRVAVCLEDAQALALLTSPAKSAQAPTGVPILTPGQLVDESDAQEVPARAPGLTGDHPAYLIYTSGSTGVPKGIVISQRNICHFLRSANDLYGIRSDDVVFQGASVAFDLSMEEIWIPLKVGATLLVATPAMIGDVERLPDLLAEGGVTVLDTVPTLLAMIGRDVPSLRLILMGGEALPAPLVARWSKPGCRLLNTYGPTEATVVATACEARPGAAVTIGRPIANYTAYVVAEDGRLLGPGEQGELWIGGPGVAKGYLKRPELTAEKFVANPFGGDGRDPILYRSGDAVSLTEDGDLAFHGRIDDQVKIRGFRVELGEIETRLSHLAGINQAAVVLRQDEGLDRLVAFMVPERGAEPNLSALKSELRKELPPYMVPDHFEPVAVLPRLSSGKVDRKALRAVPLAFAQDSGEQEEPQTETEAVLLAAAKRALGQQSLALEGDFFTELGGHSLLAARFVSFVREEPALASITLQDVYRLRNIRAIAADLVVRTGGVGGGMVAQDLSFEPPPLLRRFLCGLAQAVALPFIIGLVTLQWLGLFIASVFLIQGGEIGFFAEMAWLLVLYTVINIGTKILIVGLKWLVIGRTKPGRYPLWGVYYFRVWFVQRMLQVTTLKFLQGSPLMRFYLRLLGAKIGRDAVIAEFEAGAVDLISIGDNASTGLKNRFSNVEIIGNEMIIGRIEIGPDVQTGNSCVLGRDTVLERGVELSDLTSIPADTRVGAFEHWDGSPARKIRSIDPQSLAELPETTPVRRRIQGVVYFAAYIVVLMLGLVPIFPAFFVLYNFDSWFGGGDSYNVPWSSLPFLAWPTAFILLVASMVIIVALRWIVLPRVRPGTYSIHSWFYMRKWTIGLATEVMLETLNSLYATIYMRYWYRLMGAKIGRGSEISANLAGRYDLVDIGANNFLGDEVIFGDEEVRRGWMTMKKVKTGDRVFIGNDAVVAQGADLADDTLLGVKSKLPDSLVTKPGETWFGTPAISVPTRQRVDVSLGKTYQPSAGFFTARAIFEGIHTSMPTAVFITCGYITADLLAQPLDSGNFAAAIAVFLASGIVIALLMVLLSAAVKWLLMGAYKPIMKPMWSWWALRTEAVAVLYGGLVGKASLEFMRGTPFLPWILRIYGAKMGKGIWMDCTDVTEFDCIKIGDFCTIADHGVLQTHLYEDRVMKVGRIELGRGVVVGANTTVLYDTKVGDFARLHNLTVVMRGESIPAHTEWSGAPAMPFISQAGERAAA